MFIQVCEFISMECSDFVFVFHSMTPHNNLANYEEKVVDFYAIIFLCILLIKTSNTTVFIHLKINSHLLFKALLPSSYTPHRLPSFMIFFTSLQVNKLSRCHRCVFCIIKFKSQEKSWKSTLREARERRERNVLIQDRWFVRIIQSS